MSLEQGLVATVDWYGSWLEAADPREITLGQIEALQASTRLAGPRL
jgi:hypothetical protein